MGALVTFYFPHFEIAEQKQSRPQEVLRTPEAPPGLNRQRCARPLQEPNGRWHMTAAFPELGQRVAAIAAAGTDAGDLPKQINTAFGRELQYDLASRVPEKVSKVTFSWQRWERCSQFSLTAT